MTRATLDLYAALLLPVGALLLVLLAVLIRRRVKRVGTDRVAVAVAVAIASAFSAEGMFEIATEKLKLPLLLAIGLFAVAEAAMLAEAGRARKLWEEEKTLGRHGVAVWTIAVAAGLIVSLNSHSVVEFPIRLGMPVLVAGLWWLGYQDGAVRPAGAITWRISPRRVLVWCKLAEPGERDVIQVDRDRRITALTVTAHRLHHGGKWLRGWRTAKLRRLALAADDAMVAEVRSRIDRVHRVNELTAPTPSGTAGTGASTEAGTASTASTEAGTASTEASTEAGTGWELGRVLVPIQGEQSPASTEAGTEAGTASTGTAPVAGTAGTEPGTARGLARAPMPPLGVRDTTEQAVAPVAEQAGTPAGTAGTGAGTGWDPELWQQAVSTALALRRHHGDVRVDDIQALGIGRNRAVALRRDVLAHLGEAAVHPAHQRVSA